MYRQRTTWRSLCLFLFAKAEAIPYRLTEIFRQFPRRLARLGRHFLESGSGREAAAPKGRLPFAGFWLAELLLMLTELFGGMELYETLADLVKFNTRPLTLRERELVRPVFGKAIPYHLVRIDERAWIGPPQMRICYVSFHHINSWGPMDDSTLVHELVHVWQYRQLGSVYISRALHAQRTVHGYDYGGVEQLEDRFRRGQGLESFNLEQQAEIVADYFRLCHGKHARWAAAGRKHLALYEYFVGQIRGPVAA